MASVDRQAIQERGIPGLFLMEKAGEGIVHGLLASYPQSSLEHVVILCGKGNNGGDGFVVARLLHDKGYTPRVGLIGSCKELKGDALTNCNKMTERGVAFYECQTDETLHHFFALTHHATLWIDALLGTGAKGAPRGLIATAIRLLNDSTRKRQIVSVDIPSGVNADTGEVEGDAVRAEVVYTMGLPKIGQVVPPGFDYYNRLEVLDIEFPKDLLSQVQTQGEFMTDSLVDSWIPSRKKSAHKGSEGHLLVMAGSRGMTGAALLCAKAAITMGSGLVTAACPASLFPIYAGGVWEMLTLPVAETESGALAEEACDPIFDRGTNYSTVVIGPGIGRHASTMKLVEKVIRHVNLPVILDGDALFAVNPELLQERQAPWIVTPHPGEMARLFGVSVPDIQKDRFGYARQLVDSSHGVCVLKGAHTVIACQGESLYINPTGNSAMASGGMGDVLAGMVGCLAGKGIAPHCAAAAAVYLHGKAADIAIEEDQAEALNASKLILFLQKALSSLRQSS